MRAIIPPKRELIHSSVSGPPENVSHGYEYADQVQEVLDGVAESESRIRERDQEFRRGPFLTRTPVVALVALAFCAVVMWNVQSQRRQSEPLPAGVRETSLQVSAMVVTSAVEAYRDTNGRLPKSLVELGFPPSMTEDLDFLPQGEDFDLVLSMGGTQVRYRSEEGRLSVLEQLMAGTPDH